MVFRSCQLAEPAGYPGTVADWGGKVAMWFGGVAAASGGLALLVEGTAKQPMHGAVQIVFTGLAVIASGSFSALLLTGPFALWSVWHNRHARVTPQGEMPPADGTGAPPGPVMPPLPALPPSAADLDGLSDERIQLLHASAAALEDLMNGLGDLDRTLRPSADFTRACARAQYSLDEARDNVLALMRHASVKAWPDTEWAMKFRDAQTQVQWGLEIGEAHANLAKLGRSVARLLELLKERYPSLFARSP